MCIQFFEVEITPTIKFFARRTIKRESSIAVAAAATTTTIQHQEPT